MSASPDSDTTPLRGLAAEVADDGSSTRPSSGGRGSPISEGAEMSFARVVSFEGVTTERVAQLEREINDGEPPEGMPATEILMLHDAAAERSLVIVLFESESDYAAGDAILSAMPAGETPGRRTAVSKYEVAIHRKL